MDHLFTECAKTCISGNANYDTSMVLKRIRYWCRSCCPAQKACAVYVKSTVACCKIIFIVGLY